jgi:hypothetical protein
MLGYTLDNYRQVPFIIWNYIPQFQPQKRYVGATDEHTFMLFWLLDFDAYPNQQPGRAGRVGHFALIMDRWKIPKLCTPGLDRRLAKHIPAAVYIYIHIWWLVTCWNQTYSLYWIYWFLIWGCVKPIITIFWENTHPLNQLFRVHRVPGFWRNYPYMFADLIPDACWIATSFPPR